MGVRRKWLRERKLFEKKALEDWLHGFGKKKEALPKKNSQRKSGCLAAKRLSLQTEARSFQPIWKDRHHLWGEKKDESCRRRTRGKGLIRGGGGYPFRRERP